MNLKLDENLGERGIRRLRQEGYDVATVIEQGLESADDIVVINVCRNEERCLVTLDLDFSNPLQFNGGLKRENIRGKLWIVQRGRIRIYQQGI